MSPLRGSLWMLVLYDVAEQIHLDKLQGLLNTAPLPVQPRFKHPAPEYVRFERAPVVEELGGVAIEASGQQADARMKYFDYGVVSVELELKFEATWEELIRLSNRWINAPEVERCTSELLRGCLAKVAPALRLPYAATLNE